MKKALGASTARAFFTAFAGVPAPHRAGGAAPWVVACKVLRSAWQRSSILNQLQ